MSFLDKLFRKSSHNKTNPQVDSLELDSQRHLGHSYSDQVTDSGAARSSQKLSLSQQLFKAAANLQKNPASLDRTIPDQYQPLWELQQQRQLVEVKITGSSRSYQSMLLALDPERNLLWLDDLFPQQLILDVGDELCIRHHRQGEELVIRARIVALGSSYGTTGIALELPDAVSYQPRRRSPRYSVGHQSPLSVKIRPLGQEPSFGTLTDISAGGMRLMVAGNLLGALRHGALMPLCELSLNEELQIRCRARICAFRMGRSPYRHTQISVEFIDLEEEKRAGLARFLRAQPQGDKLALTNKNALSDSRNNQAHAA